MTVECSRQDDTVEWLDLTIPGRPVGKQRPRVTKHGAFTPRETVAAERDVRAIWREAGGHRLADVSLEAWITVKVARPKAHWRADGTLTAAGRREALPCRRPDLDNVAKLILDSLNGLAYRDDAQVTDLHVRRRWCGRGELPVTRVRIEGWDRTRSAIVQSIGAGRAA